MNPYRQAIPRVERSELWLARIASNSYYVVRTDYYSNGSRIGHVLSGPYPSRYEAKKAFEMKQKNHGQYTGECEFAPVQT